MNEEIEKWVSIDGYIDRYEVSNFGRIRNIKFDRIVKGSISCIGKSKSIIICLWDGKKKENVQLKRLVANLFVTNPDSDNFYEIKNIDGDIWNNHYKNLEWCSTSERALKQWENGIFRVTDNIRESGIKLSKTPNPNHVSKRTKKPIIQLDMNGEYVNEFESVTKAAISIGGKFKEAITYALKNDRRSAYGFKWKYK